MPESLALIRPARLTDLTDFHSFAMEAGPGITSLPRDLPFLEKHLRRSEKAFSGSLAPNEKEIYLFCLEIDGKIIGTSGLVSRIGLETPFFAFHKRNEIFQSATLQIRKEIPTLHFIEARKKPTEIGTLYLRQEYRGKSLGSLLSLSRFLYLSLFRERFASIVIAELRGVNEEGHSPFWEAIGRHFVDLDFSSADHLRASNPSVFAELFPRHPLYTILLPEEAQKVIGISHPKTLPAKKILEIQGFQMGDYLDIIDGGPHFYAHTDEIHIVQQSHKSKISELLNEVDNSQKGIVSNTKCDFRACYSPIAFDNQEVILPQEVGEALNVDIGDEILYYLIE